MPGERARSALADGLGARFADVRWVAETGSTNADLLALARSGAPEGIALVADHQTAGRGRGQRSWTAPAGASLLVSVLLRPPEPMVDLTTAAMGAAMADAVSVVAGFTPRVKWPNDLVWPGDGSATDRKLAGILAEADWPAGVVVVGVGVNVAWPSPMPDELAEIAIACNHVSDRPVDREELLIEALRGLDARYSALLAGDRAALLEEVRGRSATLGRRVRVDLGAESIEGEAVELSDTGGLVVATSAGLRTVVAGDVVHLRPT